MMDLRHACPLTTEQALQRAAAVMGDGEAIVGPDGRVSYADLSIEVATIRSGLSAAGIARGDHVAICLGNGARWVALFLAIGSLGAVAVPVNTRFRGKEMAHILRQSRSKMLVIADRLLKIDFMAMLREICPSVERALPDPRLPNLDQVVVVGEDVPRGARSWADLLADATEPVEACCVPEDVLLIQYTSGTTAHPKGVLLTHLNMCANAFMCGVRLGVRPGDRLHSARPFFHVAGTTVSILLALQHAITLVTMARFEASQALELLERERCTHFSGNDTIALMLLNHPDSAQRRLVLRGAWLAASSTIVRRVIDELGATECVAAYGLSEASPNVAQSCWWEPQEVRISARMLPQPGVEVEIRDPQSGDVLPAGVDGEILVRGWNVMQGYFDLPDETAVALSSDGWLSTGDLGRLGADGRLEFIGRAKEIIRVGGENVAPGDVEDVLHRHPKIRQAVVVSVPDDRLIEVPFAFVVLNDGCDAETDELLAWARENMAGFKAPRHVRIVEGFEAIGMTASAKVQKKHLAAHAKRLIAAQTRVA